MKKKVLSLSDTLKIHRIVGKKSFMPMFEGEVEATLKDANGRVVQQVKEKNLVNALIIEILQRYEEYNINSSGETNIVISNDQYGMYKYKTVLMNTFGSASNATLSSFSKDTSAKTWTFRATFAQPGTDRTIWTIGLARYTGNSTGNARALHSVFCGTKLSQSVTQTTVQTLEIAYRLSLTRP